MHKLSIILICSIVIFSSSFITTSDEALKWINLSEISAKLKEQPKPVLIDLYTDWCHWCKVMDKRTYNNKKVIQYLSDKFYIAKVNAETKDILTWRDKTYAYNNNYKLNDFALYVTNGQPGFPTTVIITGENTEPIPISGFMDAKEFEPILKYFGEGAFKTQTYPQFQQSFKSSW